MSFIIQFKRGTAVSLPTSNPLLAQGEPALEISGVGATFQIKLKVGDGVSNWNDLPYQLEGVTDHGGLSGLSDDDHPQYLNEARHDGLPQDNPHGVNKSQVGLSNVPNIDATQRANHTGSQLANTISDFLVAVQNAQNYPSLVNVANILNFDRGDGTVNTIDLNPYLDDTI